LSESLVLSLIGGLAGTALAFEAIDVFKRFSPVDLPRMAEIRPDIGALVFAAVVALACTLLFGVAPAVGLAQTDPQKSLQQGSTRTQGSRRGLRMRSVLIGVQVFGCASLLLITGLFVKSLFTLVLSDRGFVTENVVTAEVALSRTGLYDNDQRRAAFDDAVLNRLRTVPGVTSAALMSAMPLEGETWIEGIFRPDKPNSRSPLWNVRWVSSQYFDLLGERLLAGRFLEDRDRNLQNAVISASSARAGWPGENAIGRQFRWRDKLFTVVGIVADSRINSLKDTPVNMLYLPYQTLPPFATVFLIRSAQDPKSTLTDVRRAIWSQDPDVTISRVKTLDQQVSDSLSSERFQTSVLIAFGVAALLLAMLGIYGVLSYATAERTQEIGLRMALGATRQMIYSLTMSQAFAPVLLGLASGLAASASAGRLIERLLYGVKGTDWSVALAVTLLLTSCASFAAFLPARRAASVDPMEALRTE
jgi:predicted permease